MEKGREKRHRERWPKEKEIDKVRDEQRKKGHSFIARDGERKGK